MFLSKLESSVTTTMVGRNHRRSRFSAYIWFFRRSHSCRWRREASSGPTNSKRITAKSRLFRAQFRVFCNKKWICLMQGHAGWPVCTYLCIKTKNYGAVRCSLAGLQISVKFHEFPDSLKIRGECHHFCKRL